MGRTNHLSTAASDVTAEPREESQGSTSRADEMDDPGSPAPSSGAAPTPKQQRSSYTHPPMADSPTSGEEMLADVKDRLVEQRRRQLERDGETLTIMCIGEAGSGKTTLARALFVQPIPRRSVSTKSTSAIEEAVIDISLGRDNAKVNIHLRIIDSPGYGDTLDVENSFRRVTDYLESGFERIMALEAEADRPDYHALDQSVGVDAVLYFIAPHRLKRLDVEFLRRIHKRASVIPIISKADTLTRDELAHFRCEVVDTLTDEGIDIFSPPFAVICSAVTQGTDGSDKINYAIGREYPWGTALADNPEHSDLPHLRRTLLTEGLLDLHEARRAKFEEYRSMTAKAKEKRNKGLVSGLRNAGRFVAVVALHTVVGIAILKGVQKAMDDSTDLRDLKESIPTPPLPDVVEKRGGKIFGR